MNEQERAERLARAIDDLIQGHLPGDLGDDDLQELLHIARARLDAARASAHTGIQYEGPTWQEVQTRLGRLQGDNAEPNGATNSDEQAGDFAAIDDPEDFSIQELQEVVRLRRQMAESAAALGDPHREAVWQEVAARVQARTQSRGLFAVLRRPEPEVEILASAIDRLVLGDSNWEASDAKVEELMSLARARRALAEAAAAASTEPQARVWARIRPRLLAGLLGVDRRPSRVFRRKDSPWARPAAVAAALALLAAALGPVPATGFADHPAAQFVRLVGEQVGVIETSAPPAVPPVTTVVGGVDVSPAQATRLLGVPVMEPSLLPTGFQRDYSRFFPEALTASTGGVFVQAFSRNGSEAGDKPTILIYQEPTGDADIAVQDGSVAQFTLADGSPATYVYGSWRPEGSRIVWGDNDAQTMVFDRAGLRIIIHYIDGPRIDPKYLAAVADGMAAPATP